MNFVINIHETLLDCNGDGGENNLPFYDNERPSILLVDDDVILLLIGQK